MGSFCVILCSLPIYKFQQMLSVNILIQKIEGYTFSAAVRKMTQDSPLTLKVPITTSGITTAAEDNFELSLVSEKTSPDVVNKQSLLDATSHLPTRYTKM